MVLLLRIEMKKKTQKKAFKEALKFGNYIPAKRGMEQVANELKERETKELEEWLERLDLSDAFTPLKDLGVKRISDLNFVKRSDIEKMNISGFEKNKLTEEILSLRNGGKDEVF